MSEPVWRLLYSPSGTVELLRDGQTVWSSDADPELLEAIETDEITEADIPDVLDYLVDLGKLTDAQADDLYDQDFPEPLEDEDEDEDELDGFSVDEEAEAH